MDMSAERAAVGLETFHAAPLGPVVVPRHLKWEFEHGI
jgi:hypothetical protein